MYLASWSGGKDSCLACYRAIQKGLTISNLIHFDRPNNLHGVDPGMIRLQAELAGIPIVQQHVLSEEFEQEFKKTVGTLARNGAQGMVFGDIYLEPHKEWVDRVCGELGILPIEPLWGMNTGDILREFLDLGFETIIASGDQKLIDRKYIGRTLDQDFIDYLRSKELDVCGESGEFHTFVTNGPLFHGKKIDITDADVTGRDGFWFLNIKKYEVI